MVVTHGSHPGVPASSAWTVGNFDGLHRGHRAMLARVAERAKQLAIRACVLTFEPHPREFFATVAATARVPSSPVPSFPAPARITRMRDKIELFAEAGMDRVHVARFDASFASMTAERFIDDFLLRGLGVRWLLVGRDFRFGAKRTGDFAMLEARAAKHGFEVEAMPDVTESGQRISSSTVRDALREGDFPLAERLLGRPYTLSGRVAHGAKLGRELGYPTANIMLRRAPPVAGIFVVEAEDEQTRAVHRGVASVGRRPTVNEVSVPLLEAHLFGIEHDRDLYGRHLRVRFRARLRDEEKFENLGLLREAIARDARNAKEWFEKHG